MYTFTTIKPNSFDKTEQILQRILFEGFQVLGIRSVFLDKTKAEKFYSIHKDKDFFDDLIKFMTSGPITICVLKKENGVVDFRNLIGDTDPKEAKPGTIRGMYGINIAKNAIHGSDSDENAKKEILFFFPEMISTIR